MPLPAVLLKIIVPVIVREIVKKAVDKAVTKTKEPQVSDTLQGLIRHALTTLGGFVAAKGYIAASEAEVLAGALTAILGVAWSIIEKRKRA